MAGVGPPPKAPDRRARGARGEELRVMESQPAAQPELPTFMVERDGELVEYVWPARTLQWWAEWAESWPPADEFTAMEWEYLLDTAILHARLWTGDTRVAAELRLRVASFGVTPADRARLRITFAQANEAEGRTPKPGSSARDRRGPLKAV